MLKGKTVLLGIGGGIAAYKSLALASSLVKLGARVHTIMTKNAMEFINPISFESITASKCHTDTFDRNFTFAVEHISLAKAADVVMVAPATANLIGKMANGIADDMLTTVLLATRAPILVAPAMNTAMYENSVVQENLEKLKKHGFFCIEPVSGHLACGDTGKGKLPEPSLLLEYILYHIAFSKDLSGKRILVTAGATRENLDPVRFITNRSTGRMGIELARYAAYRGASVHLITGETSLPLPEFVETQRIWSAREMFDAVMAKKEEADVIIKSAAVADYRPVTEASEKIKKGSSVPVIELEQTKDILGTLGKEKKEGQFLCGFSMETENMLENSRKKMERKNLDMIVANNVKEEGAGFGTGTNKVTILTREEELVLPVLDKGLVAGKILDIIAEKIKNRTKSSV